MRTYTLEECDIALADAQAYFLADAPDPVPAAAVNGNGHRGHDDNSPGADYARRVDWADILQPHGWALTFTRGGVRYWRRPGKRDGISATTNALGTDRLRVFTTSTDFDATSYGKLGALAVLEHRGDVTAAAQALRAAGYGSAPETNAAMVAGIIGPPAGVDFEHYGRGAHGSKDVTLPDADVVDPGALQFVTVRELCARVDAAGPQQWLLRALWPANDYGVHAAEQKAQKSWNTVDMAVSVASGTPWLGAIECDHPGPVLMFIGEGGEVDFTRRLRAVCAARGLTAEDLPITVCMRAPHLARGPHLGEMATAIDAVRPRLVTVDPLYLSVGGANTASLSEMGGVLEGPQRLCQAAGAALLLVTHHNKSRDAKGAARITGAGPAEWGRVLITASVISRRKMPDTQETIVVTELDVIGGAIAGETLRLVRRVRAVDPGDRSSAVSYRTDLTVVDAVVPAAGPDGAERQPPARAKLLEAVRALGRPATGHELVDWIVRTHGHGLTRVTVSREMHALAEAGVVDDIATPGRESLWYSVPDPGGSE